MNDLDRRVPHSAGAIASGFSGVADAFAANFEDGLELGAAFAVLAHGESLVDIRGGYADRDRRAPWTEKTLACLFSSGKAALALLLAHEASEGRLDYEAPVAACWPEFSQTGKKDISVGQMLSHQAGLCGFVEEAPPDIWLRWDDVVARLEGMAPLWPPGSASGYHPQTFGFLAGELLRRLSGERVGERLRTLNRAQGLRIFCGLRDDEVAAAAVMEKPPRAPDLGELNKFKEAAFLKPWASGARVDRDAWARAEIPGSNMWADARSLAHIVHPFANDGKWPHGAPFLTKSAIEAALRERIRGDDLVLPFRIAWSAGLMRNPQGLYGPNDKVFGHAGFGGSCVIVDRENGLTAAYVTNKMSPHLAGDPRALRLIAALYDCL